MAAALEHTTAKHNTRTIVWSVLKNHAVIAVCEPVNKPDLCRLGLGKRGEGWGGG